MASKKKNESPKAPAADAQATGAQSLGAAGGMLLLVGGLILVMDILDGDATVTRMRYIGIGALIAGVVCWYLSGMPRQQTWEWIKSGAFALGLALVIRWGIAEPYRIPSGSMETTLHGDPRFGKGDRVFVNKWIYGLRWPFMNERIYAGKAPERWDIVVFKAVEPNAEHPTLVKRIVGMPGDQLQIRGGKIIVDGEALELPEGMPDVYYTAPPGAPYGVSPDTQYSQIPPGHYLVLGDNSAQSRDGRFFGWLPNEHIVGRVASIWWPPSRWRDFTGFSETWWWRALLALLAAGVFVRLFIARSWAAYAPGRQGINHLLVTFINLGLRLPFTPWWLYRWGSVQRGDRVLYRVDHPAIPKDAMLVGRVAGLPGEEVFFESGILKVNGIPLAEDAWPGQTRFSEPIGEAPFGRKRGKGTIPAGQYYLLTDDPEEEGPLDSRNLGWVPAGAIRGTVRAVWWPLRRAERY